MGDTVHAQVLVKDLELARGLDPVECQNMHGASRRGGFGGHIDRVFGDQDVVGGMQEGKIRIVAFAVENHARRVLEHFLEDVANLFGGAA